MSKTDREAIAREAWAQLFDSKPELANDKDLAIILSAIEKACGKPKARPEVPPDHPPK